MGAIVSDYPSITYVDAACVKRRGAKTGPARYAARS